MLSEYEQQVLREMERRLSADEVRLWPSCMSPTSPRHRLWTSSAYGGALAAVSLTVLLAHVSVAAALTFVAASVGLGLLVVLLRTPMPLPVQAALGAVVGWVPVSDWSGGAEDRPSSGASVGPEEAQ